MPEKEAKGRYTEIEPKSDESTIYEYSESVQEEEEASEEDVLEIFSLNEEIKPTKEKQREVYKGVYEHDNTDFVLSDTEDEVDLMQQIDAMQTKVSTVLIL